MTEKSTAELLQITASPEAAAAARVGDALLADPKIAIDLLVDMVAEGSARTTPEPMARPRLLPQVPSSPAAGDAAPSMSTPPRSWSRSSRRP